MKFSLKTMSKQLLNFNVTFNIVAISFCMCLFLISGSVFAEEEVKIKSDVLSVNKNDKKSVFSKNVLISLKNIKIKSDEALVFFEEKSSTPSKVIIPKFLLLYDELGENIVSAESMIFDNKTKEILLSKVSGVYENRLIKSVVLTIKLSKNKTK